MNYAERTNLIADILRPIIARTQQPAVIADDASAKAELDDMVRDLNSEWPVMPLNQFLEVGERLKSEVRKSTRSREWPTIGTLCKALKAALPRPSRQGDGTTAEVDVEFLYQTFVKHYRETGAPLRAIMRDGFPARMIADGVATWGDLAWHGGFDIPHEVEDLAEQQNRPRFEVLAEETKAIEARMKANGAPKGDLGKAVLKPEHWAKTADADDPRWEMLRRARAAASIQMEPF